MDVAYIPALSALAGWVIGGLASSGAAWLAQRTQARGGQLAREMSRREDLYRDFIVVAWKTLGDALTSSEPQIAVLVSLYTRVSRMRVLSPRSTAYADKIMLIIIDAYSSPNKSIGELRDLLKVVARTGVDPMKEFSEAAREELLQAQFVRGQRPK